MPDWDQIWMNVSGVWTGGTPNSDNDTFTENENKGKALGDDDHVQGNDNDNVIYGNEGCDLLLGEGGDGLLLLLLGHLEGVDKV